MCYAADRTFSGGRETTSSSSGWLTWPPKLALRTATATFASGAAPHDLEANICGGSGGRRPHGVRAPHSPAAIRTTARSRWWRNLLRSLLDGGTRSFSARGYFRTRSRGHHFRWFEVRGRHTVYRQNCRTPLMIYAPVPPAAGGGEGAQTGPNNLQLDKDDGPRTAILKIKVTSHTLKLASVPTAYHIYAGQFFMRFLEVYI